jgi:hypothetical protein
MAAKSTVPRADGRRAAGGVGVAGKMQWTNGQSQGAGSSAAGGAVKEGVRSSQPSGAVACALCRPTPHSLPITPPPPPPSHRPSDLRHRAGRARIRPPRLSLDDDQLLHALLPATSPQPARYRDAFVPAAAAIGSALLISNHVHYGIHSRIHPSRPQPILRH